MSCAEAARLAKARFRALLSEGQEARLERHLEECSSCRDEVLTADPLLRFRGACATRLEGGETRQIRRTVRALRRSRALEAPGRRRAPGGGRSVAAALVLGVLGLLADHAPRAERRIPAREPVAQAPARPGATPLIEGLDRPAARVYQLGGEDVSIVMIVDESLDV